MNRRAALGLLAGSVLAPVVGCTTDGAWSVEKILGWDDPKTLKQPKYAPASLQTAQRVEELGRRVIAQNTFTGIEPLFHTIGLPESYLFHRGTAELFISEGLVNKCKTDGELAAVLCAELGQMMADKRSARNAGRDKEPIPDIALAGGGTNALDGTRAAELATQKTMPRPATGDTPDSTKLAKDLLRGAGFEPTELDRAEPLLKQSDRTGPLRKQLAGSAPVPTWEK